MTWTAVSAQETKPGAVTNGIADQEEYRIGPEDALQIFVWKNETLSRVVSVRPDGKISLPLLGDVQAAGQTARELRDALVKRYAEFIAAPEISVIVNEVKSIKVSVIGEVPKAGPLRAQEPDHRPRHAGHWPAASASSRRAPGSSSCGPSPAAR